jgi:transketolase
MAIAEAHLRGHLQPRGDDRRPLHLRDRRRRRPDGRRRVRSRLAGRPPRLGKLIVLYDDNNVSLAGPTSSRSPKTSRKRFEAYGWHTQFDRREQANDVANDRRAIAEPRRPTDKPSLIAVRTDDRLRLARAGTFKRARRTARRRERRQDQRKRSAGRSSRRSRPRRRAAFLAKSAARGATCTPNGTSATALEARESGARRAVRARARRQSCPRRSAVADVHRRERQRRNARRRRHGDERDREALPELVGGSADLDPSTKTYLKGCGDFEPGNVRRPQHPLRRARARDGGGTNGIALHGGLLPFCATFFNFVDYLKPALRLGCAQQDPLDLRLHARLGVLGEDGPTHQPIEQLAMLRATPNCDRRAAGRLARNARSLEVRDRSPEPAVGARALAPEAAVPGRAQRRRRARRLRPRRQPTARPTSSSSRPARSLARVDAAKLLRKGTKRARRLDAVAGSSSTRKTKRIATRPAARRQGARLDRSRRDARLVKYVGDRGIAIGLDHFGTSAPAPAIAKEYGFTPEHVADVAAGLLASNVRKGEHHG